VERRALRQQRKAKTHGGAALRDENVIGPKEIHPSRIERGDADLVLAASCTVLVITGLRLSCRLVEAGNGVDSRGAKRRAGRCSLFGLAGRRCRWAPAALKIALTCSKRRRFAQRRGADRDCQIFDRGVLLCSKHIPLIDRCGNVRSVD
jgi:hypothetical protein